MWTLHNDKTHLFAIYKDNPDGIDIVDKCFVAGSTTVDGTVGAFDEVSFTTDTNNLSVSTSGDIIFDTTKDRSVNLILDNSGSMGWNDKDGKRYDLVKRLINRIHSTYDGDVKYGLFSFGGKKVNISFGATQISNDPANPFLSKREKQVTSNIPRDINAFTGYRLVRKETGYPQTYIDGDIVYDGLATTFIDTPNTSGKKYYYKAFAFNEIYQFSEGIGLEVDSFGTPPSGIALFRGEILKGSGTICDNDSLCIWHFDEREGTIVNDFKSNLKFNINDIRPIWLNREDVPSGTSGLRIHGVNTGASAADTDNILTRPSQMTIMGWIRVLNLPATNTPILIREKTGGLSTTDFAVSIDNSMFLHYADTDNDISTGYALTLSDWTHFAFTIDYDNNSIALYINGNITPVYTGTLAASSSLSGTFNVRLGYSNTISGDFVGCISELNIFNSIKSPEYIASYGIDQDLNDTDNGDRLATFEYMIPSDLDYSSVRIIYNEDHLPYNENDGTIICDKLAVVGKNRFSYNGDFLLGSDIHFAIFSQKDTGEFSGIKDSTAITLHIDDFGDEAIRPSSFLSTGSSSLDKPDDVKLTEGNGNIAISWTPTNDIRVKRIRIYRSLDGYPSISDGDFNGELVYDEAPDTGIFVNRYIANGIVQYYSLVYVDRYQRSSEAVNVSGKAESTNDNYKIPLDPVDGISYEVLNTGNLKIFWPDNKKFENIETNLQDEIVFYAKLTDEYGETIDYDFFVKPSVSVSYNLIDDAAEDVFKSETSIDVINGNIPSIYNFTITDGIDGISRGYLSLNLDRVKNAKSIGFEIKLNVIIPDKSKGLDASGNYISNLLEYESNTINVTFQNALDVDIINKDIRKVQKIYREKVSGVQDDYVLKTIYYDGCYIGASSEYVERVSVKYGDTYLPSLSNLKVEVHDVTSISGDTITVDLSNDSTKVLIDKIDIITDERDVVDESGNPTGDKEKVSWADISFITPDSPQDVMVYVKTSFNGYEMVKKTFLSFRSPLMVDMRCRMPLADGIDVAEQSIMIYKIDPDYPDDLGMITVPDDNSIVKWEMIPSDGNISKILLYSRDNVPNQGGVYSYIVNGVAKNVFIGPLSESCFQSRVVGSSVVYDSYTIKANIIFGEDSVLVEQLLDLSPITSRGIEQAFSYFLMEFDNVKQNLYTNGEDYAVLRITHDPSTSITELGGCFVDYLSSLGLTSVTLMPGQIVNIITDDPDVEIRWGERSPGSTGGSSGALDLPGVNSSYGSALIRLSDGEYTHIYFGMNKETYSNKIIGFEDGNKDFPCFNNKVQKWEHEIKVSGSLTTIYNGKVVNLSGGCVGNGIPSCVLVPQSPINIKAVGRSIYSVASDTIYVYGIIVGGQISLDITYGGEPLDTVGIVDVNIISVYGDDLLKVDKDRVEIVNKINTIFSPLSRSYADIDISYIQTQKSFKSIMYLTATINNHKQTIAIDFVYDWDGTTNLDSLSTIFRKNILTFETMSSSWTADSQTLVTGRSNACASPVNNKVYIFGGSDITRISNATEEYSMSGGVTPRTNMTTPRMNAMSVSYNNEVYVFGGIEYDLENDKLVVSRAVEKYTPAGDTWTTLSSMPTIVEDILSHSSRNISYGVAVGTASLIGTDVFILGGIKGISDDGCHLDENDRVLKYDILADTWTTFTVSYDRYEKVSPIHYVNGTDIFLFGGIKEDNEILYFNDAYKYNTIANTFENADYYFQNVPKPKYKSAYVQDGTKIYIMGGYSKFSETLDDFEIIDATSVPFSYSYMSSYGAGTGIDLDKGLDGACAVKISDSGMDYIVLIGGNDSGRTSNFLVAEDDFSSIMNLNGRDSGQSNIVLKKANGTSVSTTANVKAYLQDKDVQEEFVGVVDDKMTKYNVYTDNSSITTSDEGAIIKVSPRFDDILNEIESNITMADIAIDRYKIVLSLSLTDPTYFGRAYALISKNPPETPAAFDSVCHVSACSNMLISRGECNISGFDLLSNFFDQKELPYIECYSDTPWLPLVSDLSNGYVEKEEIDDILDEEENTDPIGGSPTYDAIYYASDKISAIENDGLLKTTFLFTDDESNSNEKTKEESLINTASIVNPIVIVNLSYTDYPSAMLYRDIGPYSLNDFAEKTNGQCLVATGAIDDIIVKTMAGFAQGTLGYGHAIYTYDFGREIDLDTVKVNYTLFDNTSGSWKVSFSTDGYDFTSWSNRILANNTFNANKKQIRYIRFDLETYSGLSKYNTIDGETTPVDGNPIITGFDVSYYGINSQFIFTKQIDIPQSYRQVVVSCENDNYEGKHVDVEMGISSDPAGTWPVFDTGSKASKVESGKIIVPRRSGTLLSDTLEPLISVDGYCFKTSYGPWDSSSDVKIYDNTTTDVLVDQLEYKLFPQKGYIVFNTRKTNSFRIEIEDPEKMRIGIKIDNKGDESACLYGLSYMFSYSSATISEIL